MFIVQGNNEFQLVGAESEKKVNKLKSGVYNFIVRQPSPMAPKEIIFAKVDTYTKGVSLDSGIFKEAREFISNFFDPSLKEARKIMNMKDKLGVMFAGEPGTGKTFTAGQIAQSIADEHDAVCFIVTNVGDYSNLIDGIRDSDKDRKIVIIMDEFEKTFKEYDTDTLAFLDGSTSRDNVVVIATVNNVSRLSNTITDRPSRFERIFKFELSNLDILKSITTSLIPEFYLDIIKVEDIMVKISKIHNKSVDRIKHLIRDEIALHISKQSGKKLVITESDVPTTTEVATNISNNEDYIAGVITAMVNDEISSGEAIDYLLKGPASE